MKQPSISVFLSCLGLGLFVGVLAQTVFAAPPVPLAEERRAQQNLRGGVVIGTPRVAVKISNSTLGTLAYDFPALSGPGTALANTCALSSNVTVSGARFGDVCLLGVDQVPVSGAGTLIPYVTAADTAVVQACAVGITDGGTFNMPDAGYTVRCFAP